MHSATIFIMALTVVISLSTVVDGQVEYVAPKRTTISLKEVPDGELGGQRRWTALPKNWSKVNRPCGGYFSSRTCGPTCTNACLEEINYSYAFCKDNYCLCHNGEFP